jgi:ComF family protein
MKCGKPLREEQAEYCGDCLSRRHSYDRGRALLHYQGQVKRSVYRFKYAGRREYAKAYAELFAAQLGSFLQETGAQALVPVPLHRARQRKRGYNQAALLARELSRLTGIPVEEHLVVRRKNTIPQKQLDVAQRQNNLKRAFKMCQNDVKLKTIILIDDIYTTGSTMDALSTLLKEHGTERVFFLTLAVGE